MKVYSVSQFCHFIKCYYAKCPYSECRGALIIDREEMLSRNPCWRGRLSTVDLLVLTLFKSVAFEITKIIYFFTKTSYYIEEVNCTEPFPSISVPWFKESYKHTEEKREHKMELKMEPLRTGRFSTVDLLVLTSFNKLLLKLQKLYTFLQKQATLFRKWTVRSLPLQLVFPNLKREK
jgi:hypothetical protein